MMNLTSVCNFLTFFSLNFTCFVKVTCSKYDKNILKVIGQIILCVVFLQTASSNYITH